MPWRHDDSKFWAKVQGDGVESCWLWTGWRDRAGYGQYGGTTASKVAYIMIRGEVPAGLYVDHLCSNPPCVNPWHLEVVSARMNTTRAIDRGRLTNTPHMEPRIYVQGKPAFVRVVEWAIELKAAGHVEEITLRLLQSGGHLNAQKARAAMSWLAHLGHVGPEWKCLNDPRPAGGVVQIVPDRERHLVGVRGSGV